MNEMNAMKFAKNQQKKKQNYKPNVKITENYEN